MPKSPLLLRGTSSWSWQIVDASLCLKHEPDDDQRRDIGPSLSREVSCRVDFRSVTADTCGEHTGRLESISATGCTIRTGRPLESWDALELRMYLPGLDSALRVDQAKVTWAAFGCVHGGISLSRIAEQLRLGDYLADTDFFVDESSRLDPVHADR